MRKPGSGARKGNKNAITHGMYAKYYDEEFKDQIIKQDVNNFIGETQLQRFSLVRAAKHLAKDNLETKDVVALINAIANQVTAITSAATRHSLMNDPESPLLVAWADTLETDFFVDGKPPE